MTQGFQGYWRGAGAVAVLLALSLSPPVRAEPPGWEQIGGIPLFQAASAANFCTTPITVCAREMQPLGIELGGSFTVKIDEHYQSTFACGLVDGQPTWIPSGASGNCDQQPVIMLPAQYDEDEAWNVG